MVNENLYITVIDGLGQKTQIPKAGLEHYKKQMEEYTEIAKKTGSPLETVKSFQIKEIIEHYMLPGDNGQSSSKHQKMCESLMSVDTEEYNENLREKMNQQINRKG